MPKVQAYSTYGDQKVLNQFLKFNLGTSFGLFNGLLQRNVPQYRADGCYRDLWSLSDYVLTSFSLLGRGPSYQHVAMGILLTEGSKTLYQAYEDCLPLYQSNPPAYTAKTQSGRDFYLARSLKIAGDLFRILYNTDYFSIGKDLADIGINILQLAEGSQ